MALPSMSVSEFDALIEQCTNEKIPNGEIDLSAALELSDMIRSRRLPPKDAMRCLKKRVLQTRNNQNLQFSVWRLVEVCMKNGGVPFLKEVCSREFMDCLEQVILAESTDYELEQFCSRLVGELYLAFKNDSQLSYVVKVYQKLVSRGIDMENLKPTENLNAMFDAKTPADWIDSDACMICSTQFTLLNRKHHCRSCGGVFCQLHSSKFIPLPDLGIFEPVRVCDNCFEDYDLKRKSSKGKKSKGKKRFTRSEDDDEDLRRAIELSLKENGRDADTFIPDTAKLEPLKKDPDEEDPDLKAAIEASLREHQQEEMRRKSQAKNMYNTSSPSVAPPIENNYDLSSNEEEDIHLFASLVERMKTQPPTAVLEDTQLQQLYQKVLGVRPKLNYALSDTVSKYNTVYEMNSKISDIMNMYDSMLEMQLRNISLSQQYAIPESGRNSYGYHQNMPQYDQPNSPQIIAQPQIHSPQQNERTILNYASPVSQHLSNGATTNTYQQGSALQNQQPAAPEPQPVSFEKPSTTSQLEGLILEEPSEPPYPDENTTIENPKIEQASERPYPDDHLKQENITSFDFPTVPLRKLSIHGSEQEVKEEPVQQEQLLIEL
ncbi:ESCRT-0 subunit protein VPS27 [Kluyveromyces lactis]|uniref:Vacuolar protein sorting-associated protein 27 n=1 Tax=Kluyveromyces lactis (strain ATCC 8585 / CBS 2359 / DSM 70799 / NBRC 1267 / NRRL Y-1140 / WM37) TaxID=284590 RepID=VPS27_KLULA|nr:uncharacterized protein KLLA0_F06446g [Kluyveromyces lactis]Q6CL17.1 RecName: Full=Vacuolar protein sorting-associated protein 27 [Kluyveromyces lactis NRRL Y-1140]CAG98080.1 KLLA0F06446p [Kluyveromyces lactis]|eukprot:XP_455372.1 uncharacterized protein KLLA0_F06446g [Kluyveromyces lactis]